MQTLNIIAAFIIAILSGMGIGSGGLFTIWLTAVAGTTQLAAQGLNLLFFLYLLLYIHPMNFRHFSLHPWIKQRIDFQIFVLLLL